MSAILPLLSWLLHIKRQGVCWSAERMQSQCLALFLFPFEPELKVASPGAQLQKLQKALPLPPPVLMQGEQQTSRSPATLSCLLTGNTQT